MEQLQRINVVGSSGSGKSTFARRLATALRVPYVELDALHWKPNWTESPDDELFPRLEAALSGESWVLDGNYGRTVPVKWQRVQTVIWLDLPYWLILYQVTKRTLQRSLRREELWAGNRESLRKAFFDRDSIIWWSLTNLQRVRRGYLAAMSDTEFGHIDFIRLRTRHEVDAYLAAVSDRSD